jgi:hypothetical protein
MKEEYNQEFKRYMIAINWKDQEIATMKKSLETAQTMISENKYSH